jgi:hypothetical protein
MGFAASQARLMGLISQQYDIELESQFIENRKIQLANITNGLFDMQNKLEVGSSAYKLLEGRIRQLSQADKILDMQLKRLSNQRDAIMKEEESTQKIISKNIEMSFGMMH